MQDRTIIMMMLPTITMTSTYKEMDGRLSYPLDGPPIDTDKDIRYWIQEKYKQLKTIVQTMAKKKKNKKTCN